MHRSVSNRIDLVVTAGGTAVAALITIVLSVGTGVTDTVSAVPASMGGAYALFGGTLLLLRRPSGAAMLMAAAIALVVSVLVDPIPSMLPLLILTSVVMPVIGATMVRDWWRLAVIFSAVVVIIEIFASTQDYAARIVEAFGAITIMWITVWLVWRLSWAVGAVTAKSDTLFERSPIPTWEVDYSEVFRRLMKLKSEGVTDLTPYLSSDPKRLSALADRVRVRRANPAAVELFGLPAPGLPLVYHGRIEREGSLRLLALELHAIWDGSGGFQREVESSTQSREPAWLLQSWSPTRDRNGFDYSSVIVAATNLIAQKAAAEMLADQVKQKDTFIAAVSHELRTPLAVVVGLAQELRDSPFRFTAEESTELVEMIASQSMDVAHIVEDLLVAARIDTGNITVIPEYMDVAAALAPAVPDGVPCAVEPGLSSFTDPYRFRQIVRNLVTNAIRYGGPNRQIEARSVENNIQIDVRDDGPGIPASMVDAVFQPYGRAPVSSPKRMSVGLGLAVSRELALLMGGTLEYLRDQGDTVFRLSLPGVHDPEHEDVGNSLDRARQGPIG